MNRLRNWWKWLRAEPQGATGPDCACGKTFWCDGYEFDGRLRKISCSCGVQKVVRTGFSFKNFKE